jgi:hypothetical protein
VGADKQASLVRPLSHPFRLADGDAAASPSPYRGGEWGWELISKPPLFAPYPILSPDSGERGRLWLVSNEQPIKGNRR